VHSGKCLVHLPRHACWSPDCASGAASVGDDAATRREGRKVTRGFSSACPPPSAGHVHPLSAGADRIKVFAVLDLHGTELLLHVV